MTFLTKLILGSNSAKQIRLLEEISENGRKKSAPGERQFEWDDPVLSSIRERIKDAFYANYPELPIETRSIQSYFPAKSSAVKMINRLANEGKLDAMEYIVLFGEILSPYTTEKPKIQDEELNKKVSKEDAA